MMINKEFNKIALKSDKYSVIFNFIILECKKTLHIIWSIACVEIITKMVLGPV